MQVMLIQTKEDRAECHHRGLFSDTCSEAHPDESLCVVWPVTGGAAALVRWVWAPSKLLRSGMDCLCMQ